MQNLRNEVIQLVQILLPFTKTEQVSTNIVTVISQDILTHIFTNFLNLKDLANLKCVCLTWRKTYSPLLEQVKGIYETFLGTEKALDLLFKACKPYETIESIDGNSDESHFIRDKTTQGLSFIQASTSRHILFFNYIGLGRELTEEEEEEKCEKYSKFLKTQEEQLSTTRSASVAQCVIEHKKEIAPKDIREALTKFYASYDRTVTDIKLVLNPDSKLSLAETIALRALVQNVMKAIKPINEQFAKRKGLLSIRLGTET